MPTVGTCWGVGGVGADIDVLWNLYQEHCTWERHHEQQRATASNVLLVVESAILGIAAFDSNLTAQDVPAAILLVVLGAFGALFVAKQYDAFQMHQRRAGEYRKKLDELLPDVGILALRDQADANPKSPRIRKLRLYWFWTGLHAAIALIGLLLLIMIASTP